RWLICEFSRRAVWKEQQDEAFSRAVALFTRHRRLLFASVSLVCPDFVQESSGAHGDPAETHPFVSLGLLSIGAGKIRGAPLHRQQRDRRRRGHLVHHRHRRACGLRHGTFPFRMDEILSAVVARFLDVSLDRSRRSRLEHSSQFRLAHYLYWYGGCLHRMLNAYSCV